MPNPTDHLLLPEIISKEPLSPVTRADDEEWRTIVRWTLFTLINAEEAGLTSKNIVPKSKSTQSSVLRILGQEPELFKFFPLDPLWAKRIVAQVGNYGEIFDRNLGAKGLGRNRGLNQQWNQGGILYAPPMM
jgi:general L-amino acid transport system substrate-binding protein